MHTKCFLNIILLVFLVQLQVHGYPAQTEVQVPIIKPIYNPDLVEGDMLFPDEPTLAGRGVASRGSSVPWTNGIVPYEIIPGGFAYAQEAFIIATIQKMERILAISNVKCIQFREKNATDIYYLSITNGNGCNSYVGQNTGVNMTRTVSLQHPGCIYEGTIMHELLHALGFYHEQSRPDRDSYVLINYGNIQSGQAHNFNKYTSLQVDTLNTSYDYDSVMHYESTAFSSNGLPTIVKMGTNATIITGDNMSAIDIDEVRIFYNCSSSGVTLPTTPATTSVSLTLQNTLSSVLTNKQGHQRYAGWASTYYYYDRYQVIAPQVGYYTFMSAGGSLDTYGYFYKTVFNPNSSSTNLIAYDRNSGGTNIFKLHMNLRASSTYELVVTTYNPNRTGNYTIYVYGSYPVTIQKIDDSITTNTTTTTIETTTSSSNKLYSSFLLIIGLFISSIKH